MSRVGAEFGAKKISTLVIITVLFFGEGLVAETSQDRRADGVSQHIKNRNPSGTVSSVEASRINGFFAIGELALGMSTT